MHLRMVHLKKFAFIRTLFTLLQEPNPPLFAELIKTNNGHVEKIQDEVSE